MSERDDLADLIWGVEAESIGTFKTGVTSRAADAIADAILAAGYRKVEDQVIPAEAVEAAAKVMAQVSSDSAEWEMYQADARAVLEAAAPHMLLAVYEQGWEDGREGNRNHMPPTPGDAL